MAPLATKNIPVTLSAPNDTVLIMQDQNSPWMMDLNTSVTIIFGILGLILQAGQIFYGRRQITRMPSQTDMAQSTEMVLEFPNTRVPERGQAQPSRVSRGPSHSMPPQHWSRPAEAPPIRPAGQSVRTSQRCRMPPPPNNIRRRNASQYSNRGQRGGASAFPDRARYSSQYNNNTNEYYLGQGFEV